MTQFVTLLRGINVGGNKRVPMVELKALYERLGFSQVQTLLQSGNVVCTHDVLSAVEVSSLLEGGIRAHFGFESRVIVRTADEWSALAADHPYSPDELNEPSKLLVTLWQTPPAAERVSHLLAKHAGKEIIRVGAAGVYIVYPDGMGQSKLDNGALEKALGVTCTGRNWNTVQKLLALVR